MLRNRVGALLMQGENAFQCRSLKISNVVNDWNGCKAVRIYITYASNGDIIEAGERFYIESIQREVWNLQKAHEI